MKRKAITIALLILLLPVILPLAILGLALFFINRAAIYLLVWVWWLPREKDVLYVSSASPIWKDYMDAEIFPLVAERAVALNWSSRRNWPKWSFSAHVFRSFAGRRNFNPLVILFRPSRGANIFRFWPSFKERKHGDAASLEQLRRDLTLAL